MRQTFLMMLPWEKILDFSKMYTNETQIKVLIWSFRLILKLEINDSCKNVRKNAKISKYRNDFFQLVFFSSFLTLKCCTNLESVLTFSLIVHPSWPISKRKTFRLIIFIKVNLVNYPMLPKCNNTIMLLPSLI